MINIILHHATIHVPQTPKNIISFGEEHYSVSHLNYGDRRKGSVTKPVVVKVKFALLHTPSCLPLLLHRDVATTRTSSSSRRSHRGRPSRAQDGRHLSLHEGPGGAVGRAVQGTTLSTGAVHFPVAPPVLDVTPGAREAEPGRKEMQQVVLN